ncbi:MAG: hypothetical protein ACKN9V_07130, partial [Pseudomonadota bacterium]
MKLLNLFVLCVFGATTALAGVGSAYLSKEQVQNKDEVVDYGREYALGSARDSANHASAVAGATGIALTSAGVGFLLAGNLPLGATLISMGSIEFAQMGASQGVGQQNGTQRNELVMGSPQGNSYSDTSSPTTAKEALNSQIDPRLNDFLKGKGIDPDLFRDSLISGQFNDPSAALAGLGLNPSDYSTKALEKAQMDAQKEFAKVADNVLGNMG